MNYTVKSDREVTEGEYKALVTIETAERIAVKVDRLLDAIASLKSPYDIRQHVQEARALLDALTDATTTNTVTAVKANQALSDRISTEASEQVRLLQIALGR